MGRFLNCLKKETILQHIDFNSKDDALKVIAATAKKSPILDKISEKEILSALKDREMLGTTGFGGGIAIPHCRLPNIKDFVIGIITSENGSEFDSLDGEPVNLFIFIIAPEHEINEHIRILSAISRSCQNKKTVKSIIAANTPDEIIEILSEQLHENIDKKEIKKYYKFNICTGNTEFFQEILQLFAALDTSSVFITEARQVREYLSEIPLFMGFWGDTIENPWQLITATVEQPYVNDTIRKIEGITGNLNDRDDISVTIQELFFCSGLIKN